MEKNMSKMFGAKVIKSPFAQSRLCPSKNAQKKFCINFERYDLSNGANPHQEILYGIFDSC